MARIPDESSVSGPINMGPVGGVAVEDKSGLVAGIQNLAAGGRQLAGSLQQINRNNIQAQNTSDLAKARAEWVKGTLALENNLSQTGDYEKHVARAQAETEKLRAQIAATIRDPQARQAWLDDNLTAKATFEGGVQNRVTALENQNDRVNLDMALADSARLISDPSVDPAIREGARADINASIEMARQNGLYLPAEAAERRRTYLDTANQDLALNLAKLEIRDYPNALRTKLGVSSNMGSSDVASSAAQVSGGVVPIESGVAAMAAEVLGDEAFPDNPALAAAYLKDPEVNAEYAAAAMQMLTDRYDGDVEAAIVASAPDGGTVLADAWVKSGKDDGVLPAAVRTYYRKVVEGISPQADNAALPVVVEPGVDISHIDVAVLDRYEKLQGAFGDQLTIISGYRDPAHNKEVGGADRSQHMERRAIDIDVANLSEEDRVRFLQLASAAGFTGIGVYKNSIHLDTGDRRAWGPDYHSGSVPGWAKEVIDQHVAGEIVDVDPNMKGVAPEYRDLSFEQRLQLDAAAQQASDQQSLDMRAGIDVAVQNAPSAIMAAGAYNDDLPTAEDFVQAYGAAEGIARFKQFDASVDVAQAGYAMQTMSNQDIDELVNSMRPASNGDEAGVQVERYQQISQAAAAVQKARTEDPVAAAMSAFPNVAKAWEAAGQQLPPGVDEQSVRRSLQANALNVTMLAQERLGIENPVLLPKSMADSVAGAYNNAELPQTERMGALTSIILSTDQEDQQEAIMQQLIDAGVPPNTESAMAALVRGDSGAAAYLFRASMTKPNDIPLPPSVKAVDITESIQSDILAENSIGDVVYGLSSGTAENINRMTQDMALFESAVRLRLADGSASNLDQAIELTKRDMYGDVKVDIASGAANAKITLPTDEDPAPLHKGFDALLFKVGDALTASMTPAMSAGATSDGSAQILTATRDNYVDQVLDEGYFTNSGDGFVFIDPKTGAYVPTDDGGPLMFTREEVLAAGQQGVDLKAIGRAANPLNPLNYF